VRQRIGTLLVGLAITGVTGCSTLLAVKGEQRRADTTCVISGTVTTDKTPRGPLVVALFTRVGDEPVLVDYFTAAKPGPWVFGVQAGTYWVAAFEDVNDDGAYQDEPFYRPDPARPLVLAPGQRAAAMNIVIPLEGRALRSGRFTLAGMMARGAEEQQSKSIYALSAVGKVTTLDDPRFDFETAKKGMWKFYDFLIEGQAGIYFLEEYNPKRIPVLFVHGIGGTPKEFETLIGGLDRHRFQPWVLYYPSGARLDTVVTWLDQLFTRLEVELKFEKAVVVAHSMGGLVSRGFILRHHDVSGSNAVRMFVTISSPLGGMESAGEGVAHSPIVVRSWYGLAPGSPYLDGLFYKDPGKRTERRRLPEHVAYHMLFGFKGGGISGSSDGTVMLASQLRPEAQEEALSLRGYDEDHTSILSSTAVSARLNEILAEVH
jgi:pimeloyl-ACP methyl ester carboxylesterase